MLEPAVARPKRDQPRIFGIGERHARLGDALEPGGRRVALVNTAAASIGGDIAAARGQPRPRLAPARRTSAAGNSEASLAKATAASAPPLAATGFGPNPGGSAPSEAAGSARLRITAGGQIGRDGDRQGARQFVARREAERDGAAARQHDARRRPATSRAAAADFPR